VITGDDDIEFAFEAAKKSYPANTRLKRSNRRIFRDFRGIAGISRYLLYGGYSEFGSVRIEPCSNDFLLFYLNNSFDKERSVNLIKSAIFFFNDFDGVF